MKPRERRITLLLASIYASRMLGLFMILPVFSLYANDLQGATPALMGLTLGVYGLMQAIFQIPFGMSSDRVGRKPILILGLLLFLIGSVVAAESHHIYGVMLGRALQGAGAIGSTLIALLADSTAEENRLKAMSLIGMSIGFSFILAMVLGPIVARFVGLAGIFWLIACLALFGLVVICFVIPIPAHHFLHRDSQPILGEFKKVLMMPELLRLNFGIFCLHAVLMALFIALPITLVQQLHFALENQWKLYLPVLFMACLLMFPVVIISEAKRLMKPCFIGAIALLTSILFALAFLNHHLLVIAILLCFFFAAFTFLEASLPSLISKIAPIASKGTAMGFYSTAQFLGVFCGAGLGGMIFGAFGLQYLLMAASLLAVLWLMLALSMKPPLYLSSKILSVSVHTQNEARALEASLRAIQGVQDVYVSLSERIAYLKYDKKVFSLIELDAVLPKQGG